MQEDELPKVGIDSNQNTIVLCRLHEQFLITRVWPELPRFDDIVGIVAQPLSESTARAAVDKEAHQPATEIGSRLSPAMTA